MEKSIKLIIGCNVTVAINGESWANLRILINRLSVWILERNVKQGKRLNKTTLPFDLIRID